MALEINGAVEIAVGILILHEVLRHQDVGVAVRSLGRDQFRMGGHGNIVGICAEGDLVQQHLAVLISG